MYICTSTAKSNEKLINRVPGEFKAGQREIEVESRW